MRDLPLDVLVAAAAYLGRSASVLIAFAVESAGILSLCFWWYNDSVVILAAVFFLSCLAFLEQPLLAGAQVSYVFALAFLSLMKPNIAGITIVGAVALLLVAAAGRRIRLLLLTCAAIAIAVLILSANRISVSAMAASYLSVAGAHGGIASPFGFWRMVQFDQQATVAWYLLLAAPLIALAPTLLQDARKRDMPRLARHLLYLLPLCIAVYGLITNGEFPHVECTVLIAACGVVALGEKPRRQLLRHIYTAVLFGSIAADLYYGASRLRVYTTGPGLFFEWADNQQYVNSGFFRHMRVSSKMTKLVGEMDLAVKQNPGPFFFGPRLEFSYAAYRLPSPEHSPAWWEPNTSFAASDTAALIRTWKNHHFETLIFDRGDFPYYPQDFLDVINHDYVKDERYDALTVYRRRAAN